MEYVIITVTLFIFTVISVVFSPFLRSSFKLRKSTDSDISSKDLGTDTTTEGTSESMNKAVTAVILLDKDLQEIKDNVPYFTSKQVIKATQYIFVQLQKDKATEEFLSDHIEKESLNAHITFVPETARYISRTKMAVTLGIKSAANPYVAVTDCSCKPLDDHFFYAISRLLYAGQNIVLPYTVYDTSRSSFYNYCQLMDYCRIFYRNKNRCASEYSGRCFVIDKQQFIDQQGYSGALDCVYGEYALPANKYTTMQDGFQFFAPETHLMTEMTSRKTWRKQQMATYFVRSHMQKQFRHQCSKAIEQTTICIVHLASLATLVTGIVMQDLPMMIIAPAILLLHDITRICFVKHCATKFGTLLSIPALWIYEWIYRIRRFSLYLSYLKSDKQEYSTHKV